MKYQFTIDGAESLDRVAKSLMLSASAVFHNAFPDQWEEAMVMLATRIAEQVRQNRPEDDQGLLRVVNKDDGSAPPAPTV